MLTFPIIVGRLGVEMIEPQDIQPGLESSIAFTDCPDSHWTLGEKETFVVLSHRDVELFVTVA